MVFGFCISASASALNTDSEREQFLQNEIF